MAKNKKEYIQIIHNATKKHWIWYTIIITLPTIWFTFFCTVLGTTLKIKGETGNFTILGKILSAIIILISIVISLFNNYYASKSEFGELERLRGHIEYLEKIENSVDSICDEKAMQIKKTIYQVKKTGKNSPEIISNPSNQLKKILEQIAECLVSFMERPDEKYSFKDFFVTLAYNFPEESDEWSWLEGTTERGMSLNELTDLSNKTTINYLRTNQKTYYFNNCKEDAKREDRYVYDEYDLTNEENGKPVGSIFCYNFKIRQNNLVYVDAILSISTQVKRFAEENDKGKIDNAKDNMVNLVKEHFGRRITIELGLLYLDYVKN